ncbi:hypothetical protein PIN31115_02079 [Pandoraea iniqua]|uniref:Uncharacterized protein n=2 Tax=Pandoraea iniqua TaxID=2508288 RepID=A0A5E4UKJ1_9BURK|nr:hypothetical protein PIN31115_02079 [Pandoraea iniqua]
MKLAMEINVTPRIECSEGVYAAFATVLGTEVFNTGPTEREAIERLEHSVRMILKVELGAKF